MISKMHQQIKTYFFTRSLLSKFIFSLLLFGLWQKGHAAAFQLYEVATPITGYAGVGQAALAQDASISYFNPAGMTALPCSQMLIGTQVMNPNIKFHTNASNTFSGLSARKTNLLIPGAGVYLVYSYSPCLQYGLSINSPYGGAFEYGDGWVGRYFVQSNSLVNFNINPSMAMQLNEWFSVGGGLVLQYTSLNQTGALVGSTPGVDGQSDIRVSNLAPGFNLGVLFSCNQTKIGLAYRSQIKQTLKGDTFFLRTNTRATHVSLLTPHSFIASIYSGFGDFALVGELGWAKWNNFRNTVVTIDSHTLVIPRKWKNTYRVGVGGEYQFSPCFLGTLGVSYDSSPTTEAHRLPDLPMDRQMRYGIGLLYTTENCARLGLQYSFIDLGKAPLHLATRLGTLSGSYSKNHLHVLSINVNFGL